MDKLIKGADKAEEIIDGVGNACKRFVRSGKKFFEELKEAFDDDIPSVKLSAGTKSKSSGKNVR